ncbi:hypothetical protein ACU686_37910 [Yinghuangia aomiensis]
MLAATASATDPATCAPSAANARPCPRRGSTPSSDALQVFSRERCHRASALPISLEPEHRHRTGCSISSHDIPQQEYSSA